VFLQIMALARNVRPHALPIRQLNTGDLSITRVGFLRALVRHEGAHAFALVAVIECGRLGHFVLLLWPLAVPDRLVERAENGAGCVETTGE